MAFFEPTRMCESVNGVNNARLNGRVLKTVKIQISG